MSVATTCVFDRTGLLNPQCTCHFHTWLFKRRHESTFARDNVFNNKSAILKGPESHRDLHFKTISPVSPYTVQDTSHVQDTAPLDDEALWLARRAKRRRLQATATTTAVAAPATSPGLLRLIRFLEVVKILGKAPWASMRFSLNDDMISRLVASHLPLIVGTEAWELEKASLYPLISAHEDLSNTQNVVWITNRQQGKTSTLALFLAAMSFMSPAGGNLFCVYSTNLDRAQELTRAAKKYIYWITSNTGVQEQLKKLGLDIPVIKQDNERAFSVTGQYTGVVNTVLARPKSPDSCRGDAPRAAIFDEIGFVSADFWYKFAYPLLQIAKRVFTCATTPAPSGSFFSVFGDKIIERNANNDFFFRLINHSLVCPMCYEENKAEKCVHKLGLIPPWKSLLRFTQMKRLVPAKRMRDYQDEVLGVMQPIGSRYFPAKLVEASFLKRPLYDKNPFAAVSRGEIYVGVDPASHHRSFMGISALTYGPEGQLIFMGLSSVGVNRCEALQIKMIINAFLHRLARHPWLRQRARTTRFSIIPIIECNNNEILAQSILEAIETGCSSTGMQVLNPFTKTYFDSDITEHLGVWTTHRNKLAGIQQLYGSLLDGRVFVALGAVTVGEVYRPGFEHPSLQSQRELVTAQLKNFRDLPDGSVSGKDANNEDDLGMTPIMLAYWSYCIRATVMGGNFRMGMGDT